MTLRPENEAELAEAIRSARGPLRIRGGGTRDVGMPCAGEILETGGLSGIRLYEPGALTLVAGAGTTLSEIEQALAAEGQQLAFEPMDHRVLLGSGGEPTIGSVLAANVSGPRRVQVGAARDFALGVRFVDGNARTVASGGRVMKNVTGYDLVRLMAGSWGTLGVLSEVAFKVLPAPAASATLEYRGLDAGRAVAVMAGALGSPFDVTGAAWTGAGEDGGEGRTLIRIEGSGDSVAYRVQALSERLAPLAGTPFAVIRDTESRETWRAVRDVEPLADRPVVWRLSVKPSDAPEISAALTAAGLEHDLLLDWGGGLMWLAPRTESGDGGAAAIRGELAWRGGHARLEKAPAGMRRAVPVFHPPRPAVVRLSAGLRRKFDPRGILNPGLMGTAEAG